jgi:hypothetical protein
MANKPDPSIPTGSGLVRIIAPHLLVFGFPLYAFAFLAPGPESSG